MTCTDYSHLLVARGLHDVSGKIAVALVNQGLLGAGKLLGKLVHHLLKRIGLLELLKLLRLELLLVKGT